MLDLELRRTCVGEVRWEALDIVHAAVQGEGARSDLGDLACRSFGSAVVVSAGDLYFADSERLDAVDPVDGTLEAVVVEALLIEPEVERVPRHDLEGDVITPWSFFHVV